MRLDGKTVLVSAAGQKIRRHTANPLRSTQVLAQCAVPFVGRESGAQSRQPGAVLGELDRPVALCPEPAVELAGRPNGLGFEHYAVHRCSGTVSVSASDDPVNGEAGGTVKVDEGGAPVPGDQDGDEPLSGAGTDGTVNEHSAGGRKQVGPGVVDRQS